MASLRSPSAWADAQRAFHLAYDDDPTPFPRTPVIVTWLTRGNLDPMPKPDPYWEGAPPRRANGYSPVVGASTTGSGFIVRLLSAWRHGTVPHDGLEVTVVADDGRTMRFTIGSDPAPLRRKGSTAGVLVGELGMNATACVEVDGHVIWPTMPPIEQPGPDHGPSRGGVGSHGSLGRQRQPSAHPRSAAHV